MRMRVSRAVTALFPVIGVACALAVALPRATPAQERSELPEALRADPEQPAEAPLEAVDRVKILSDLYDKLSAAEDKESAELIAEAIQKLWLASGSDTVDLLMQRAMQLVEEEEYDVALEILDSVVAIAPDFAEGWNQRATVYFLKHDYASSMNDLRHVLSVDPQHFRAISGLALILQELGNKRGALEAYRRALEVHPYLSGVRQSERELAREVEGQGI